MIINFVFILHLPLHISTSRWAEVTVSSKFYVHPCDSLHDSCLSALWVLNLDFPTCCRSEFKYLCLMRPLKGLLENVLWPLWSGWLALVSHRTFDSDPVCRKKHNELNSTRFVLSLGLTCARHNPAILCNRIQIFSICWLLVEHR